MRRESAILPRFKAWLLVLAGAALLAAGPRAGAVLPAMLATGPIVPAGPMTDEEEERHDGHAKLAVERRSHQRSPGSGRTVASRVRIPVPGAAKPAPSYSTTHHESDLRNGLGAPLQC